MKDVLKKGWISICGARENNLKNISVDIPKDALTVITGPSGSGKSSLALDILYTEGKRRYMESLSSYARQFLGIAKKPDVDHIQGLCPAVAIDQKTVGTNPRSTVGTITEIYDYLRVLFARVGSVFCPQCKMKIRAESPETIAQCIVKAYEQQNLLIVAPVVIEKKGEFKHQLLEWYQAGYYRFIIDGKQYRVSSPQDIDQIHLKKTYRHSIDIMLDAVTVSLAEQSRVQEAVERSFSLAHGMCKIVIGDKATLYSAHQMCVGCGTSFPELEPRLFSFNSPLGACSTCHGLGVLHIVPWARSDAQEWKEFYHEFGNHHASVCGTCQGKRLNPYALSVFIQDKNIDDMCGMSIRQLHEFCAGLTWTQDQERIAGPLLKEIMARLSFLDKVGLSYLSLHRTARTLSGGEGQRIRLATQIGAGLTGVLYILDEPSIGLHQRDNDRLIETLKTLKDQGNTVVVVEHDHETMLQADYIIDMGPAAGVAGGYVTAVGTPTEIMKNSHSLTGQYLAGKKEVERRHKRRTPQGYLQVHNLHSHNLKNISCQIPLKVLCCVSGVSGSGKSTFVLDEIAPAVAQKLQRGSPMVTKVSGVEQLQSLVVIDQSPIGRTPRSNPATYVGIFDDIRALFAALPESNMRGYSAGRFSFNVAQGRCFDCHGEGTITVSMQFLADVIMTCKTCNGSRYNKETLQITYKGKNIAQILALSAQEAVTFFAAHTGIAKRLQLLVDVGLGYLTLGQPSTTLSGGEAQRIKLVNELAKRGTDTLYILDEPTTGLHSSDVQKLLAVLHRLVDKGNSMIVIEHNLDVLKNADYLIDLGPEGGDQGGTIVAQGTVEEVAACDRSHTGRYVRSYIQSKVQ